MKDNLIGLAELSHDMRALFLECPTEGWFVATDLTWSRPGPTGHALSRLVERDLLLSARDPAQWERSRYTMSPHGKALRASHQEQQNVS